MKFSILFLLALTASASTPVTRIDIPQDCVLDSTLTKESVCTVSGNSDFADCSHVRVHFSAKREIAR